MSSAVDSHLERRISEHLDGELDDAQQAELFRALLRDPRARALMDRYAEQDRRAAAALKTAVVAPPRGLDRTILAPQRRRTIPWGQLAATAAVLAMAVGLWFVVNQTTTAPDTPRSGTNLAANDLDANQPAPNANDANPSVERHNTATASAIDQITGGIDEASMAVALTAAAADETPWWRAASTGPIEDGRLIDHATAGPLLEGYQNARTEQQDAVIGVIDLTNDRMYWFKLGNTRTTRDASNLEL